MPKLTIQNAITASQAEGLARPVLVSKATYNETVTLAAGVSLYGGYDRAANWTRNVAANTTSIISSNANVAAVTSSSGAITNTTVVSGFWITGSSNGTKPSGIEISAGNPNITNNTINGGATIQTNPSSAVAVRISGGNPTVQNCSINGGTQKGAGFTAGVYVSAGSATIRNNTIDGGNSNQAGCAGATNFGVRADVVFKLIGNTIRAGITGAAGCGSNTHSYGVQLKGGAAVVSNNTITAGAVVGPGINKYTAGIDCIACAAAIRNNTIVAGTGAAAVDAYGIAVNASSTPTIQNNIVFNPGSAAAIQYGVIERDVTGDPVSFENNLIFGFATAIYRDENSISINDIGADCILDGVPNNELNGIGGIVSGNRTLCGGQTMAQVMVNPTGTNFHLVAGSPAIDFGKILTGFVDTDKDARARPQGASWDIGAYEH